MLLALLPLLALLAPPPLRPARAQPPDAFVFIIASSTKLRDVPSHLLRTTFQGLRTEYQGVPLIPFNLPLNAPARVRLDRVLLGLEPHEVSMFWIDQRVRDGRRAPRTVEPLERLVQVVSQLPGAIACVPATALRPSVRALYVDGKAPTDDDYLLAR